MKWSHLPESGGIYDQHPVLIERFYYIMAAQAEQQEKDRKEQQSKQMGNRPRPSMGGRGRNR